ncbi:MAG: hypothetical protein RLP44_07870 [Aggregatilineales bacterium]
MSVFSESWRECLREHYKQVVRNDDFVTKRSLVPVLHHVGFTEDELRQLEIMATMRADGLPEDFVPDLEILAEKPEPLTATAEAPFQPHPLECQCPQCVDMNLIPHDKEGQPIEFDDDDPENPKNQQQPQPDKDSPEQMSLF